MVVDKVATFQPLVLQLVQNEEVERAQSFHDIFVEIALSHIKEIVEGRQFIIDLLIELFRMPGIVITS